MALKQLETLEFDRDYIRIKEDRIQEVAKKVFIFEENPNIFTTLDYLGFLGSAKSLFELEKFENETDVSTVSADDILTSNKIDESQRVVTGKNILLYGVPGSGKSWTIEHEYCKKGTVVERLVFHPDYTNSDFIGQILPCSRPS